MLSYGASSHFALCDACIYFPNKRRQRGRSIYSFGHVLHCTLLFIERNHGNLTLLIYVCFLKMEVYVKKFIPEKYIYSLVNVSVDDINREDSNFSLSLRVKIKSKEEFDDWLNEHQRLSTYTYRVQVTRPRDGRYVVYKVILRVLFDVSFLYGGTPSCCLLPLYDLDCHGNWDS